MNQGRRSEWSENKIRPNVFLSCVSSPQYEYLDLVSRASQKDRCASYVAAKEKEAEKLAVQNEPKKMFIFPDGESNPARGCERAES